MKLAFLLLLGCAIMLSHQQRNHYNAANRMAVSNYWPFQSKHQRQHESQITVDEDTAEDFSEYLMARQAFRASPNHFRNEQRPLSDPFTVHRAQVTKSNYIDIAVTFHSQLIYKADEMNAFKSPSPLFRQNLDGPAAPFGEDFAVQSNRNLVPDNNNRPPLSWWASLFGLNPLMYDRAMDEERARFYFNYFSSVGSTNGGGNPFMKTIYYFTTSTATSCSFVSCFPASYFAQGLSTVTCRRKKRSADDILKQIESLEDLSPSPTEKIETSEMVNQDTFKASMWAPNQFDLKSSKDDANSADELSHHHKRLSPGRSKRLFYNLFVYSTTITSYVITTKVTTTTVSNVVADSKLSCRPSGVVICQ